MRLTWGAWRQFLRARLTGTAYWWLRARRHGVRGALNLAHTPVELEAVLAHQRSVLFPLLQRELRGDEKLLLDFGCGPGRFTPALAEMIAGRAIGVDPVDRFLRLAPRHDRAEYRRLRGGAIPMESASADVVWVCLVMGGIANGPGLSRAVSEMARVLKPGGLVFLVENTTEAENTPTQFFRTVAEYQALFTFAGVRAVGEYLDLGQRISVMAGRSPKSHG